MPATRSAAAAQASVEAVAIVVGAGAATRMQGADKVFAPFLGRTVLEWSVGAMAATAGVRRVVAVVAAGRESEAAGLLGELALIVPGGASRPASVAAGLAALEQAGELATDPIVLVHDAARPLASSGLAAAVAAAAAARGAAVPVVPVPDTLKRIDPAGRVEATVDRTGLAAAQTPQGCRASLLRAAFVRYPPEGEPAFTDEAALLEACRIPVHAIPGDPVNLKLTVPEDLDRASRLAAGSDVRVGLGADEHPFGPGSPLVLGGLEIDRAPRLHGHSDGDVALHAIADALLGAAGLGDLGRLFPADATTPRGAASRDLLTTVVERLAAAGWRPRSVDLTIVGARPRLGHRLDEMRPEIGRILGLDPGDVSVKASTGNLTAAEGAGRAIRAVAVAAIERRGGLG